MENTISILDILTTEKASDDRKDLIFWQNFSKYGLMQVFGGWFKHSNWSITLVEPISEYFEEKLKLLADEKKEDTFKLEFQLFLISSILASDTFIEFEKLKKLVETSKLNNLDLLAIIDMHYNSLMKHLPKSFRKNEELKTIHKRVKKKIQSIPEFAEYVNKPINQLLIE